MIDPGLHIQMPLKVAEEKHRASFRSTICIMEKNVRETNGEEEEDNIKAAQELKRSSSNKNNKQQKTTTIVINNNNNSTI